MDQSSTANNLSPIQLWTEGMWQQQRDDDVDQVLSSGGVCSLRIADLFIFEIMNGIEYLFHPLCSGPKLQAYHVPSQKLGCMQAENERSWLRHGFKAFAAKS